MRIMVDTNVLISMIFFPSVQMEKVKQRICENHSIVLCSHIVEELQSVVERKFINKVEALDNFLENLPYEFVNLHFVDEKEPEYFYERKKRGCYLYPGKHIVDVSFYRKGGFKLTCPRDYKKEINLEANKEYFLGYDDKTKNFTFEKISDEMQDLKHNSEQYK